MASEPVTNRADSFNASIFTWFLRPGHTGVIEMLLSERAQHIFSPWAVPMTSLLWLCAPLMTDKARGYPKDNGDLAQHIH